MAAAAGGDGARGPSTAFDVDRQQHQRHRRRLVASGNRPGERRRRGRHDRLLEHVQQCETITLTSGELELSGGATTKIQGPGANLLTVSGGGASRVFDVEAGSLSLSGMRITGGRSNYGGGVYSHDSTLMLTNVTISGNSPADSSGRGSGGGLACRGDASTNTNTAILTNCTISGNFGILGGGIYNEMYSSLTMTDCTLSNNSGADLGGGLLNEGTATLVGCTISGNSAKKTSPSPGQGGGVDNGGTMTLANCTVSGNYA